MTETESSESEDFKTPTDGLNCKIEDVDSSFLMDEHGKIEGVTNGKLVAVKHNGLAIKARSTIKFIFQIIIGILIYSLILSSLMILKNHGPIYVSILMIFIALCAFGIGISVALYLFYPHIAPRVFDLHHGFFYIKPLSFYIGITAWDSSHNNITALHFIRAIQIIRKEVIGNEKVDIIDQTNIILKDGQRLPLTLHKNTKSSHIKENAETIAKKLTIPVWDMSTITQ